MPRPVSKNPPAYSQHKASGRAVTRLNGRDHYLGRYGSPESHAEYERLVSEWRAEQLDLQQAKLQPTNTAGGWAAHKNLTIADVILRYWRFAESCYVKDGKPTHELTDMKYALRPLRKLYGNTRASLFGPLALKAVRQHMIDGEKLSRRVINQRVNRIKRFWKWSVSEELVPASVFHSLQKVTGLLYGRTTAREKERVKPVAYEWIAATLPYLTPHVRTMVELQRVTGIRTCELVQMRPCDIDRTAEIWIYQPAQHKNTWRGHPRTVPLGFKAQQLLARFLQRREDQYLFSPRESKACRNAERRALRQSKMTPSQRARKPRKDALRPKRDKYDTGSYHGAIQYGISKANRERATQNLPLIPAWYPLQIRHSRGTEVRKTFGLEGAQVALGHANASITEVYAEKNLALAIEIARKIG